MIAVNKILALFAMVFLLNFFQASTSSINSFDNDCIGCLNEKSGYFCVSGLTYSNDCDSTSYSSFTCKTQYEATNIDFLKCLKSYTVFIFDLEQYNKIQKTVITNNINLACKRNECTFTMKKGDKIRLFVQNSGTQQYEITFLDNQATNTYGVNSNSHLYNTETLTHRLPHSEGTTGYSFYISALTDTSAPLFKFSVASTTTTTTDSKTSSNGDTTTTSDTTTTVVSTPTTTTITSATISISSSTKSTTPLFSIGLFCNHIILILLFTTFTLI
eukprot:403372211